MVGASFRGWRMKEEQRVISIHPSILPSYTPEATKGHWNLSEAHGGPPRGEQTDGRMYGWMDVNTDRRPHLLNYLMSLRTLTPLEKGKESEKLHFPISGGIIASFLRY